MMRYYGERKPRMNTNSREMGRGRLACRVRRPDEHGKPHTFSTTDEHRFPLSTFPISVFLPAINSFQPLIAADFFPAHSLIR